MTVFGAQGTRFSSGTTVRLSGGAVEIRHPVALSSVRLSATEFSALLNGRQPLSDEVSGRLAVAGLLAADVDIPEAALNWMNNGWNRSLEFFQWSEAQAGNASADFTTAPRANAAPLPAHHVPRNVVDLPDATPLAQTPLDQLLVKRRTKRRFVQRPLPLETLSALVRADAGWEVASAFHMYVIAYDLLGAASGIYAITPSGGSMALIKEGLYREEVRNIICGMPAPRTAAITLVLVADFDVWTAARPYERGLRELYLELGRVAQRLTMAAEGLGLGSMITPATNDVRLAQLLDLPSLRHVPVYTLTVGFPPGTPGDGRVLNDAAGV